LSSLEEDVEYLVFLMSYPLTIMFLLRGHLEE